MNHFWKEIDGYFTFPDFYEWVVGHFDTRCMIERQAGIDRDYHFVEVGAYTGQSAAFLGVELLNHAIGTDAHLDLIDCEMTKHRTRENLARLGNELVTYVEMLSTAAATYYSDRSLDFVFIDADHEYKSIRADIDAWLPKVRKHGIIAGHDHCPDFTGVMQAVTETFPRYEVWRGMRGQGWGDQRMVNTGQYYACWCVRV